MPSWVVLVVVPTPLQALCSKALEGSAFTTCLADDLATGKALCGALEPDLVIVDEALLLEHRSADEPALLHGFNALPTVVLTADGDIQNAVCALQAGSVDCLEKSRISSSLVRLAYKLLGDPHGL